jgi:hypothetical protein
MVYAAQSRSNGLISHMLGLERFVS